MKNKLMKVSITEFLQNNIPWLILIALIVIYSFFSPSFLTVRNITNILIQNSYIVICAMGVLFIMLSGNMDLSIGYQLALNGIFCAILQVRFHLPVALAVLLTFCLGIVLTLFNTLLALKLKLPQILVSLATMTTYQGIAYEVSGGKAINQFPEAYKFMGQGQIGAVSIPLLIAIVIFAFTGFFLTKTYYGRYVYALGGNEEAARLSGLDVNKIKIMISVIAGIFISLSAMLLSSRMGSAQASIGPGTEFTAITAICLGGVSIWGGRGKVSGVLAGILTLAVISNGMQMAGLGIYMQYIAKGLILVFALALDMYQKQRRANAKNIRSEIAKQEVVSEKLREN